MFSAALALITGPTAASRSASSATTIASLPPISAITRLIQRWPGGVLAASSLIRSPTPLEPVNAMKRVRGSVTSASPTVGPSPGTKFRTPGGSPSSCIRSTNRAAMTAESDDGLRIAAFPVTIPADVTPAMIAKAKFQGGITTPTPSGRYVSQFRSPAIVTGNAAILKPSSDSAVIAARFVDLMHELGLPPGVLNFVPGDGPTVGEALVTDPRTRFIAFTGSKGVGLRINELAAKTPPGQRWIKRVIAEMGGKDAIVVADDADLDAAVGPVINAKAAENIRDYVEIGKGEGRLLAGGHRAAGQGFFIEPTVIADVAPGSRVAQEEIFGPVLAVIK